MGIPAVSAVASTKYPVRVAREVESVRTRLPGPAAGLVFVCGELTERLDDLAERLSHAALEAPLLLVPGAGVVSDHGDGDGNDAAAIILWSGGTADVAVARAPSEAPPMATLGASVRGVGRSPAPACAVFTRPDGVREHAVDTNRVAEFANVAFGAATADGSNVFGVEQDGRVVSGASAALLIRGLGVPRIASASAARLISRYEPITETEGPHVLRIGQRPALEVLAAASNPGIEGSLLLAALGSEGPPNEDEHDPLDLRPIRGVDPARGSVVLAPPPPCGQLIAFAVRDPSDARRRLDLALRAVQRAAAGAAPRFALCIHGPPPASFELGARGGDIRLLRTRLPGIPFAGIRSNWQLGTISGRCIFTQHSAFAAVFTSPS